MMKRAKARFFRFRVRIDIHAADLSFLSWKGRGTIRRRGLGNTRLGWSPISPAGHRSIRLRSAKSPCREEQYEYRFAFGITSALDENGRQRRLGRRFSLSGCTGYGCTDQPMSNKMFLAYMFGWPLIGILLLVGLMAPRYVPSNSLMSAANSTASPDLAKKRMIASFVGRCRSGWNFDRLRDRGVATLYSLESDAGLLARTSISCIPGKRCTVVAQALMDYPFPTELRGKPLPTRIWGCGRNPRDWARKDAPD